MITVPAHKGIAIARFIDSWVVGVNEWGRSPRRLVVVIKVIRDISIRDQVRPLVLWVVIICFRVDSTRLCWMVISRLLMRCLDVGISSMGNIMMGIVAGWFRIVGVANKVNRFSFILVVSGYWGFAYEGFFVGGVGSNVCLAVSTV